MPELLIRMKKQTKYFIKNCFKICDGEKDMKKYFKTSEPYSVEYINVKKGEIHIGSRWK